VMTDEPSDDVGESLMQPDEDFEPPEVPFQPKPTSVSVAALRDSNDFSGDSNFTTMPKLEADRHSESIDSIDVAPNVHDANTKILGDRGRAAQPPVPPKRGRTQPPPPPPPRAATARAAAPPPRPGKPSTVRPIFDEDLHAAPTMIIDIGRMRKRGRG
jgi:hypothetical protein